ncbi:MAG: nuclear transport factor 2 family protein [Gammaproteobacteria bacterium]
MNSIPKQILRAAICASLLAGGASVMAQDDAARLAALKERVNALAEETNQVEAVTQLQRLGRAFGYYIDKGYFGEAADLFTDAGSFQWGVDGVYRGKERIRELLTRHGGGSMNAGPGLPFGRLNLRMQLQPVITIAEDGNSAKGRWREWALLGQYEEAIEWGDAVMEDDYVKEDGVWKIAARRYYPNFVAPYEGGWAALPAVSGDWRTQVAKDFPPDEPAPTQYQPFPAVYVPPYHYSDARISAIQSDPAFTDATAGQARPNDALGRLEAMADAQQRQLARARSVRAIENLQAMYGFYIDKGKWNEAAQLFADDATYEFGQSGVYVGRESIADGLSLMGPQNLREGLLNNFVMVQPIIHVDADNATAKARWRSDVMLTRGGPRSWKGRWGGGVYENEYVNDGGTWKFSKLHYYVTFWGDYDEGWAKQPIPMDGPSMENPPDRPPSVTYESFPKLQVVPFHYPHPVTGQPHAGE